VSIKHKFLLIGLTVVILGALIITGCTGAIARGWAGGVVSDGTIFIASMKGKVIAIDATGNQLKSIGTSVKLVAQAASSGLSCIPSCSSQSVGMVIYSTPVVADAVDPDTGAVYQVVYIGGVDGKIYAYTLKNSVWSKDPEYVYPRQGNVIPSIIGNIILDHDTIYYALSDGTINALNAKDLTFKWSYATDSKIWSAPAVDGSTLYVGSFDKTVYALNTADGTLKWTYKTDGAINSTPVIDNNTVYIGDYSRHFYAINAATGNSVWKFPGDNTVTGNPKNFFWAKPAVLNGVIYAANLDGSVYTLDVATGKLLNTFHLGDSISSAPVVIGTNVIVATSVASYAPTKQQGNIFIIDTLDNSKSLLSTLPHNEGINAPLFAYGNSVYVHTTKDNLYEIDTLTGKLSLPFSLVSETYPTK